MKFQTGIFAVAAVSLLVSCGGNTGNPVENSSDSSSSNSNSHRLTIEESSAEICYFAGNVESEHNGFNGAGYLNGSNNVGASLSWLVQADQAVEVNIDVRFAHAGLNARPAQLTVNGEAISDFEFPISAWDDWQHASAQVSLAAGIQTLELVAINDDGLPNIDEINISGSEINFADCPPSTSLPNITVWIAGDSTVQTYNDSERPDDQAGWGQMLHEQFNSKVNVQNQAIGGRTARRFIDEGRLDDIWSQAQAGDIFLVQFGTNDGHRTATYTINGQTIPYYLDPNTDFKDYLQIYIDGALNRGIEPVLVSPPPRNSAYCTGGNGTGAHAQAIRELAAQNNILLVDLNQSVVSYLTAICPPPSPEDFFLVRPDGSVDGTHFQENGARIMSGMIAQSIKASSISLSRYAE